MADPKTIRINDADVPDRLERFEKALKRNAADGNAVIRELVDAYVRYVEENDCQPTFPVQLVPRIPARRKRA